MSDKYEIRLLEGLGSLRFGATAQKAESCLGPAASRDTGGPPNPNWQNFTGEMVWQLRSFPPSVTGALETATASELIAMFGTLADGRDGIVAFFSDSPEVHLHGVPLVGSDEADVKGRLERAGVPYNRGWMDNQGEHFFFKDGVLGMRSWNFRIQEVAWAVERRFLPSR